MSIGSDRWVETAESRTEGPCGWWGQGMRHWNSLPPLGRLGILVALAALVPLVVSSDFLVRVGVNGMLLALLAVGLNVSVGWAGLLDLGYPETAVRDILGANMLRLARQVWRPAAD